MVMDGLSDIRRRYAEDIRAAAELCSAALVDALANVPRERFLGPGPWQILSTERDSWRRLTRSSRGGYRTTPDTNPGHLYRDVLVAIDPGRGLNNGLPSALAFWLDALDLHTGDHALHVGCGTGYYTAIMAEVVGPTGRVVGVEIDAELAARARENLAYLGNVEVLHGDGGEGAGSSFDAIFINAGVSYPRDVWLDSLKPGGRLILPLTTDEGKGGMLKVERGRGGYVARFLSTVSVYPCAGSRDAELSGRLRRALAGGQLKSVKSLRRGGHEADGTCWIHGRGFCLSTLAVSEGGEAC
jgi:protein-L-isoaspartate(D-aspartate) O-methyltransferase